MKVLTTRIIEHHGLKYRIEMRDNSGVWQQRHVWYPAPATFVNCETAEEWILSSPTGPPRPDYYTPLKGRPLPDVRPGGLAKRG